MTARSAASDRRRWLLLLIVGIVAFVAVWNLDPAWWRGTAVDGESAPRALPRVVASRVSQSAKAAAIWSTPAARPVAGDGEWRLSSTVTSSAASDPVVTRVANVVLQDMSATAATGAAIAVPSKHRWVGGRAIEASTAAKVQVAEALSTTAYDRSAAIDALAVASRVAALVRMGRVSSSSLKTTRVEWQMAARQPDDGEVDTVARMPFVAEARSVAFGPAGAIPLGYYNLCVVPQRVCEPTGSALAETSAGAVHLTRHLIDELKSVNEAVNRSMDAITDKTDVWTVDARAGDCEDFALAKKQRLIDAGWPSSALLIALATTRRGAAHAVLIARTDYGDLVLDNLRSGLRGWQPSLYRWRSIQSPTDKWVWLSIRPT